MHATAIGFLRKLLDGACHEHLQMFCAAFMFLTLEISFEHSTTIFVGKATSLDLLCRRFLGRPESIMPA